MAWSSYQALGEAETSTGTRTGALHPGPMGPLFSDFPERMPARGKRARFGNALPDFWDFEVAHLLARMHAVWIPRRWSTRPGTS